MKGDLKLRCSIVGHEQLIKSLATCPPPSTGFVSASQDGTVRVWQEETNGFAEKIVLRASVNPIAAICALPPSNDHPQGLLAISSEAESTICVYGLDSPQKPVYQLTEHTGSVCSLAAGRFGSLLSGSDDKTARVWFKQKCNFTLLGHTGAVWSVAIMPEGGRMLTASEDKSIRMWKTGKCEQTFLGHEAGVRCVALLDAQLIVSCGDDRTARLWSIADASCVRTYTSHTDRVRAVAVLPSNGTGIESFVSCGDDRTLRVWQGEALKQTVVLPSHFASAVCVLPCGDIVTGTSDASIFVFTTDPLRVAADSELRTFSEKVAQLTEVIRKQNATARDDRSELKSGAGRKQLFNGKEYDFVFDVEIYKDRPPLKLPYNLGEDPHDAASTFIKCSDVDARHLEMVAKFIVDHATTETLQQQAARGAISKTTVGVARNEFFPESVYITFNLMNAQQIFGKIREFNNQAEKRGGHEFTSDEISVVERLVGGKEKILRTRLFLLRKMLQWPPAILFPVLDALRLAVRIPAIAEYLCDATDDNGVNNSNNNTNNNANNNTADVGAVTDDNARRIDDINDSNDAMTDSNSSSSIGGGGGGGRFLISFACRMLSERAHLKNQLLMLRVLCNLFQQPTSERWATENSETLLTTALTALRESPEKPIQVALGSFLLNLTICHRRAADDDGVRRCVAAAASLSEEQFDPEALFRLLVTIGTAVVGDAELTKLAAQNLDLENFLNWCGNAEDASSGGGDRNKLSSVTEKNKRCSKLLRSQLGVHEDAGISATDSVDTSGKSARS